jgi:hypothetical protein
VKLGVHEKPIPTVMFVSLYVVPLVSLMVPLVFSITEVKFASLISDYIVSTLMRVEQQRVNKIETIKNLTRVIK